MSRLNGLSAKIVNTWRIVIFYCTCSPYKLTCSLKWFRKASSCSLKIKTKVEERMLRRLIMCTFPVSNSPLRRCFITKITRCETITSLRKHWNTFLLLKTNDNGVWLVLQVGNLIPNHGHRTTSLNVWWNLLLEKMG